MKVAFTTFGCQMNANDTETMKGILSAAGHEIVEDEALADVIIVNTCAVRKKAEDKFFGKLGRLKHLKNTRVRELNRFSFHERMPGKMVLSPENESVQSNVGAEHRSALKNRTLHQQGHNVLCPYTRRTRTTHDGRRTSSYNDPIIGICGCIAETRKEELLSNKAVNFVFGTRNTSRIGEFLSRALTGERFFDLSDKLDEIDSATPRIHNSKHHAWVTIIYGCDKFCSYCIVPYARGREKSRPMGDILEEVRSLAENGYKEITYLGQNVDSYGKDLSEDASLAKLLSESLKIEGLELIWFLTSYPRDFNNELIDVIASDKRIARSIHLPIQSGSDRTLKAMNRGYTKDYFLKLVDRIRKRIPDTSISTDIIVGFPGESEQEHVENRKLLDEVKFDRVNLAIYSPRPGTRASQNLVDDVSYSTKTDRLNELLELQKHINRQENAKLLGKTVRVIAEERINHNGYLLGRTSNNKIVLFKGTAATIGELVQVKLLKITAGPLYGEIDREALNEVRQK